MKNIKVILVIGICFFFLSAEYINASDKDSVFLTLESVELPRDLQVHIFEVAKDYHISPYIIMGMIELESTNNPSSIGDNGKSYGLMQIMKKYHIERMERLGVTNLLDPYQSILTGIDYLCELLQTNSDIYWALMCYNGGFDYANKNNMNPTDYAEKIVARSYELEKEMYKNEIIFRKTMFLESKLNKGVVN